MSGGVSVTAPFAPSGAARVTGSGADTGGDAIARLWPRVPTPPAHGQDARVAREWPLRSFLELGALPGAVPCARLHAKAMLWEWGLSLADEVELVVSEIATNAIQASFSLAQPATVRLWVLSDKRQVLIMVWDGSPRCPVPLEKDPSDIDEGGRGLMLVGAISDQWSWYATHEYGGKVVWALLTEAGAGE
jgi:anti-sigma regulatory factor (Ser/Thr protein kinase)